VTPKVFKSCLADAIEIIQLREQFAPAVQRCDLVYQSYLARASLLLKQGNVLITLCFLSTEGPGHC